MQGRMPSLSSQSPSRLVTIIHENGTPSNKTKHPTGSVDGVHPRSSVLHEPRVANVSRLLLVFSLAAPPFDPGPATRYLVAGEAAGLDLSVVLNKADLVEAAEAQALVDEVIRVVMRGQKWGPGWCGIEGGCLVGGHRWWGGWGGCIGSPPPSLDQCPPVHGCQMHKY